MVKEAEANAAADKARKELVEAVNGADSLIHSTEKAMSEHGDKIDADGKAAIETALADLKAAKDSADPEAIREKTNTLAQASMKLGEAMYAAQNAAGAEEGEAEKPADDGVVDAEFEEVSDSDDKKSA
jgi:molecular chaperone DnaK